VRRFDGRVGRVCAQLHVELGATMVPFAGYLLPVHYKGLGVLPSHLHTRAEGKSSLWDVSHMGQARVTGKDRAKALEKVMVGDFSALGEGEACLTLLTNEAGGIIDDAVVTKYGDFFSVVVNGACKQGDLAHIGAQFAALRARGLDVELEYLGDAQQLIALQGPGAAAALAPLAPRVDLGKLPFMHGVQTTVDGADGLVTRCGYTGEDGFEISVRATAVERVTRKLLAQPGVLPAGLGARDSLRLEAGLCLYGNDIDTTTTPIEAGLAWTIPKSRRADAGFLGAATILDQLNNKTWNRRRVGLVIDKAPARQGTDVFAADGKTKVGVITSGTMSPCLKQPISMAYVDKAHHKDGTKLKVVLRGKEHDAVVAKMPFVPTKYFKPQ
jgi:aminomethyltransferase